MHMLCVGSPQLLNVALRMDSRIGLVMP
jgi:hypothetical protein